MKQHIRDLCERVASSDHINKIDFDLHESNDEDMEVVFKELSMRHKSDEFFDVDELGYRHGTLTNQGALLLASVLHEGPNVGAVRFVQVSIEEFSAVALVIQQRKDRCSTRLEFKDCYLSPNLMTNLLTLLRADALFALCITACGFGDTEDEPLDLSGALRNNRSLVELAIKNEYGSGMRVSRATITDIPLMLRSNKEIHSLCLSELNMPPELMSLITMAAEGHKSLSKLDMSGSPVNATTPPAIAGMLRDAPYLSHLNLSYCGLGLSPLDALVPGLASKGCSLVHLDMTGNRISKEGARVIGSILLVNQTIATLVLTNNAIDDRGASFLESALARNHTLLTLHLENNQIGPLGAKSIANGLRLNCSLRNLLITRNEIGDDGAETLANMLTINFSLRVVEVDGFGKHGFQAFVENLPNMSGLERVYWGAKEMTVELGNAFIESLELNASLLEVTFDWLTRDKCWRSEVISKIQHLLTLNRGGRRILKSPTPVPVSLWPPILARSSRKTDVIYNFLREKPEVFFCNGRAGKRKRDEDDPSPSAPGTSCRHADTGMQHLPVSGLPPSMPQAHQGFHMQPHSVAHQPQYNQFLFPPLEAGRAPQDHHVPHPSHHMVACGYYQMPMASHATVLPPPQLQPQHPGFPMPPSPRIWRPAPENPPKAPNVVAPPQPSHQWLPPPPHMAPTYPYHY